MRREIITDFWVRDLLKDAGITFDAQGCSFAEVNNALKTASKKRTGKVGFPEFIAVVKDYLLVIEDKADVSYHLKLNEEGVLDMSQDAVMQYAVNGAVFYGKHLAQNTSYKKILAFGVSGNEKNTKSARFI